MERKSAYAAFRILAAFPPEALLLEEGKMNIPGEMITNNKLGMIILSRILIRSIFENYNYPCCLLVYCS